MTRPARPTSLSAEVAELRRTVDMLARSLPMAPVLTADPSTVVDGQFWILTNGQFCYVIGGVVRRITGA